MPAENPCLDLPPPEPSPLRGLPSLEGLEYHRAGLLVLVGMARAAAGLRHDEAGALIDSYTMLLEQFVASGCDETRQPQLWELRRSIIERLVVSRTPGETSPAALPSAPPLGRDRAVELLDAIADADRFGDPQDVLAARERIIDVLSQLPDLIEECGRLEGRIETLEYVNGMQDDLARELLRRLGRDTTGSSRHDLRMAVDTVIGDRRASELRRDEMASFALSLLEHLRRLPTSDLPSDIEQVHHSVVASPRTRETEETARTHVQAWGDRLVAERAEAAERALREILETRAESEAEAPLSLLERAGVRPWSAMSALQRGIWIGVAIGLIGSGAGQLVAAALV